MPPRLPHSLVLAALGVLATSAPLVAQVTGEADTPWHATASVDVGGASVTYDDYARATVGTIAPMIGLTRGRLDLGLHGALSRFETGNMSAQGTATADWVTPALGPLRGELSGDAGVLWYRDANPAVNDWLGTARLHVAGTERAGAWAGAGAGEVVLDVGRYEVRRAEAGLWAGAGPASIATTVVGTRTGTVRYSDFTFESRLRWPRVELAGSVGSRVGDVGTGARRWLEGSATFQVGRRYGVMLAAGRYPPDATRGAPGARYAALTMRVATDRITGTGREAVAGTFRSPPAQPPPVPAANGFAVREVGRGTVRLTIDAPRAERVDVMGDFTDWEPVTLTRDRRGRWTTSLLRLAPGAHRLNVRVDGGPWGVPPGMAHATDEYGGVAGLFVVR